MPHAADPTTRVLVTGANRGMGLAFARHYARRGCRVLAACRKPGSAAELASLAAASGGRLRVAPLDTAREESITALAADLSGRGDQLDLVLNNAGVSNEERFGDWTAANFAENFRVNATGPALVGQAVAPLMRRGSVLVNLTSGMGSLEWNLHPDGPLDAYAVSKAALNLLTRRLAAKLAPRGVAVVAINPGWVQTDMGGPEAPDTPEEAAARIAATIERLSPDQSGRLLEQDGKETPF